MVKFKQLLGAILFMVFTTTVVDAHALSHLFEDEIASVLDCDVCDEFTISFQEDFQFIAPHKHKILKIIDINIDNNSVKNYIPPAQTSQFPGKYYNKPPPLT